LLLNGLLWILWSVRLLLLRKFLPQEGVSHHTVDVFETLQDCQTWLLFIFAEESLVLVVLEYHDWAFPSKRVTDNLKPYLSTSGELLVTLKSLWWRELPLSNSEFAIRNDLFLSREPLWSLLGDLDPSTIVLLRS
jgi:hypothetical protein